MASRVGLRTPKRGVWESIVSHHVILVPGFLGFGNLGRLRYFVGVREALTRGFARHGEQVRVHEVDTLPTASIRQRAARLRDSIVRVAADDAAPIHVIGHSSGGLDARLALSPCAQLPSRRTLATEARVDTLVTVAAPHRGTPLADFFGGLMGKPMLRFGAAMLGYSLEHGQLPLDVFLKLGRLVTRFDAMVGLPRTALDHLFEQLFDALDDDGRSAAQEFIQAILADQSLVFQLTAAGCDLLSAYADPPTLRRGCVLTRAAPPKGGGVLKNAHNIYAQLMYGLYTLLHSLAAVAPEAFATTPTPEQARVLQRAYGEVPARSANDGVVPTLSQLWGELVYAANADHLDVIGHFASEARDIQRADLLPTHSRFDEIAFERLWSAVADFVLASSNDLHEPAPTCGERM